MLVMKLQPISLKRAREFVNAHHRHNLAPAGHRYSIGLYHYDRDFGESLLAGCVIVSRPVSRHLDTPGYAEIVRLCTAPWAPKNTCSRLYRAAWRSWKEMGGEKIFTYTLQSESGASLRAAGFTVEALLPAKSGSCWQNREGRKHQTVVFEPKIRWSISSGEL